MSERLVGLETGRDRCRECAPERASRSFAGKPLGRWEERYSTVIRTSFRLAALALAMLLVVGSTLSAAAQQSGDATPAPAPQLPVTVTDVAGNDVTVTDVSRIVPLSGDIAEIVYDLG